MSITKPAAGYREPQLLDSAQPGPAVLRMMLGARLRQLREAKEISRERAGERIWGSQSKIGRLELGKTGFKPRDVSDLLRLYEADEAERVTLLALARQANRRPWWHSYADVVPSWFHQYLGFEQGAILIRNYEVQFVPGLLQTAEYARAVVLLRHASESEEMIERRVELRMKRQQVLHRPEPTRLWAVVDEAALRRPMGSYAIMWAQLERLLELSELPHITIQVMPFHAGGHAAAGGPLSYLRLCKDPLPDVVYLEQLTSAVYPDRPSDIKHYQHIMDMVSAQAAQPAESRRILLQVLDDLKSTG